MDINERINSIGKYFSAFNVQDGVVFLATTFPDKWTLFDPLMISQEFNVQIKQNEDKTYFLCDISDGLEPIFNAADFIIEQNKVLEEKTTLLKEKVEELRSLFEQESLDRLKGLKFAFSDTIKEKDANKEAENVDTVITVDVNSALKNASVKKKVKSKKTKDAEISVDDKVKDEDGYTNKINNADSSLMDFVKNELENE